MRSLRLRLLLAVAIALAAAVGALGYFSSRMTQAEFRQFQALEEEVRVERRDGLREIGEALEWHHRERGSWSGVESRLDEIARESRQIVVLLDATGAPVHVAAPLDAALQAEVVPPDGLRIHGTGDDGMSAFELGYRGPSWPLAGGAGALYVMPAPGPDEHEAEFLGSVDRWLWLGAAIAGVLALGITAVLGQRILGPVQELTTVVGRVAEGDLDQRVEVRSRDEIGRLATAFNAMAASLARGEELRRSMVSDVAHELRTPLANLRGQLEALQDGLLEPRPETVASLHEEVMLLARLVDDLQELALAEAGQLRFEPRPLDVAAEIRRAADRLAAAGREIRVDVPVDLPPVVADPERLGQVLGNLLANAAAHTPDDGAITVSARRLGHEVEIAVADDGEGVAPEHLPYVFERFYRTDPSRHRGTGGAGLGLAIVKQLVEAHGGRVEAASEPGSGCVFTFTLPVAGQLS